MQRFPVFILICSFLLLPSCARSVYQEQELTVETLTLSEVYGSPPKVVATLKGWTGVCERLEVRQRLEQKTFSLSVFAIYEGPADAGCPALAQEYTQTLILDATIGPGVYTVVAGDERATFEIPADYQPEMTEPRIEAVDIVLRETFPVQVVAYITYDRGCDPTPFVDILQRREGDTYFISVRLDKIPQELVTCPPIKYPVTEQVTLETTDLEPGTYTVNVNGVVKSLELP